MTTGPRRGQVGEPLGRMVQYYSLFTFIYRLDTVEPYMRMGWCMGSGARERGKREDRSK